MGGEKTYVVRPKDSMAENVVEMPPEMQQQPPPEQFAASPPGETNMADTPPCQDSGVEVIVTAPTPPSPVESPVGGSDSPDGMGLMVAAAMATDSQDGGADTVGSISPERRRRKRPRPRRDNTVVGVTDEARKVLEQYLKRSFSQNDASPLLPVYQPMEEMDGFDETDAPSYLHRNTAYQRTSLESIMEDDDATSHSPVSKTNSLYSSSSHSSSFRHRIHIIRPLPDEKAVEEALKKKTKVKKTHRLRRKSRKDSTSTSSSESDLVDSELVSRRKKNFFRRAAERFRQSFRKAKEKSAVHSPSDAKGVFGESHFHRKAHIYQEIQRVKTENGSVVLRTVDPEQMKEEKRSKSPFHPKDLFVKKKGTYAFSEKEICKKEKVKQNKGLFESLLKQIRKGGEKLRRKGSKEGSLQKRSRSADAITIHSVRPHDNGSIHVDNCSQEGDVGQDRKRHLYGLLQRKGSLGETRMHGVNNLISGVPAGAPPPVPLAQWVGEPMCDSGKSKQGHHSYRKKMYLDGLVKNEPHVPYVATEYELENEVELTEHGLRARCREMTLIESYQGVPDVSLQGIHEGDGFDEIDICSETKRQHGRKCCGDATRNAAAASTRTVCSITTRGNKYG